VGTVFELSPAVGGGWTEAVLHSFVGYPSTDEANPIGGVVFDTAGNLYGTTYFGGIYGLSNDGYGTVFELSPVAGGTWSERVLHSFGSGKDGIYPYASLVVDGSGNLYGTTSAGGAYAAVDSVGYGTVFEVAP
jgi:uncharacterized repeat protein (TIGR03803 family)